MAERRFERTQVPEEWLQEYNTFRVTQGIGVGELAVRAAVDRKTARNFINGTTRSVKSEAIGIMVNALRLNIIDRLDLLRKIGFQLPFRGIFSIAWNSTFGSVGFFVDEIMIQEGLTEREEQQMFGNILLPRAVSIAHAVHGLGPQNAANLPL